MVRIIEQLAKSGVSSKCSSRNKKKKTRGTGGDRGKIPGSKNQTKKLTLTIPKEPQSNLQRGDVPSEDVSIICWHHCGFRANHGARAGPDAHYQSKAC
jgi:hypothetical protein